MKKLALIAALAALPACSQPAEDNLDTDTAAVEASVEGAEADAGGTPPGTYDVKRSDGSMGITVITEDGRFSDTDAKGQVVEGAFTRKDGKDCFDPDGDAPETCWTITGPADDGSLTGTAPDGAVVTVTPKKN